MHVARLEVSGVRGFYGDRAVDLDLTRPDGSCAGWTVVAGRNGSGKSTLLQALALVLAGPRSTGLIPSLADWLTDGTQTAEITAILRASSSDSYQPTIFEDPDVAPKVWMRFERGHHHLEPDQEPIEPEFSGVGLDSLALANRVSSQDSASFGWFYAGYGPFRHLGSAGTWRPQRSRRSKLPPQVSSLFDESVSLADAVDWLIEQHLYQLEKRAGATNLLKIVMTLLDHGLLPDDFQICRVDSDGLWVSRDGSEFPLREMSDGYRAVTALVVDIIHQMSASYRTLKLTHHNGVPTLPYPGVVLIDEVDTHLHVSWQKIIGTWLKEHFPEIQFIVTTHSPYICQSADPGGLILLPNPGEYWPPHVIDQDLYERVVYGSGDDAILTDLFGVSTPYSEEVIRLRNRLGDLEVKILDGSASDEERDEFRVLSQRLTSSLSTRAAEIAARLGRERAGSARSRCCSSTSE